MQHIHLNREYRIQNTTIMQHREQDTETETNNHAENSTQPQHRTAQNTEYTCSAHNYRTYSLDLYHEQIYIKNSDTIEVYTILQDKV